MFARILIVSIFAFFSSSVFAQALCVQKFERGTPQFNRCMQEQQAAGSKVDAQMAMNSAVEAVQKDTRLPQEWRNNLTQQHDNWKKDLVQWCRERTSDVSGCMTRSMIDHTKSVQTWHERHIKKAQEQK